MEEDTYATPGDFQRLFAREMTDLFEDVPSIVES